MKLAKSIYNEEGRVLLGEGKELTAAFITRLEQIGISMIYIQDPRTDDIVVPELITPETRARAIAELRGQFRRSMEDAVRKRPIGQSHLGKVFRNVLTMIFDDLASHQDAMIMLMDMSVTDNYLYQHSLNVCIYTSMLGMSAGYDREQLMTVGLGALLHDLGKTHIPQEILKKPGKLTSAEFEAMKKHAEIGYRLLKDEPNMPLLSAHCAFQHHERVNGSGYPRGIDGSDIHEYAKWIGLVDSYDAMTTSRVYRGAMLPHQAVEILYAGAGTLYEQSKVEMFRDRVALYPIGLEVRLSSGETGIVVDVNSTYPHRPILRLLTNEAGETLHSPIEVDLSKRLNVIIDGVGSQLE